MGFRILNFTIFVGFGEKSGYFFFFFFLGGGGGGGGGICRYFAGANFKTIFCGDGLGGNQNSLRTF